MGIGDRDVDCAMRLIERGYPVRSVAREFNVDESTLRYHRDRRRSGQGDGRKGKPEACSDYDAVIQQWLAQQANRRRPDSVQSLYEHLVSKHGFGGNYKSVLRYVRRRQGPPKVRPARRVETRPGAQAQVDWVQSRPIHLEALGGPVQLQAFIMTLSHSRMWSVIWSQSQDLLHWLAVHNEAFQFLMGVPWTVRIDNLKTGVASGAGAWAKLHEGYASYADQLGFTINPTRVRQAQDKGKVERRGHDTKWTLIDPDERFSNLASLQQYTNRRIIEQAQQRLCPVTGQSIYQSWQAERAAMQALPPTLPEPFDVQVNRRVGNDCLVHFEGRKYTVPFQYIGRTVPVRGCAGTVRIFADGQCIAEFPRGTACRELIDQDHYEGPSTDHVIAPTPLGEWGQAHVARRSWELADASSQSERSIEHYQHLLEMNR